MGPWDHHGRKRSGCLVLLAQVRHDKVQSRLAIGGEIHDLSKINLCMTLSSRRLKLPQISNLAAGNLTRRASAVSVIWSRRSCAVAPRGRWYAKKNIMEGHCGGDGEE